MIFIVQVCISMSYSFFDTGNLFFFWLHFSMLHYNSQQKNYAIGFAGNVAFQYVLDYCLYAAIWKWPCKRGFALSDACGHHNIFGWIITFRYAYCLHAQFCQYSKIMIASNMQSNNVDKNHCWRAVLHFKVVKASSRLPLRTNRPKWLVHILYYLRWQLF